MALIAAQGRSSPIWIVQDYRHRYPRYEIAKKRFAPLARNRPGRANATRKPIPAEQIMIILIVVISKGD